MNYIFLAISFMLFSGCSLIFPQTSLYDEFEYERKQVPFIQPEEDFQVVSGDDDRFWMEEDTLTSRMSSWSSDSVEDQEQIEELRYLEKNIARNEYVKYREVRDKLTVNERIYYLNLNPRERAQYLRGKGLSSYDRAPAGSLGVGLRPGLTKDQVSGLMGQPAKIDYAGNIEEQNERWSYVDQNDQVKYLYFESGRLHGWSN